MNALYRKKFTSLDDIKQAIQSTAQELGFAVVTHRSYPNATKPSRIVLRCRKGRRYVSQHQAPPCKARPCTSTRMTGCTYRLTIAIRDGAYWLWRAKCSDVGVHNHALEPQPPPMQVRAERKAEKKDGVSSV